MHRKLWKNTGRRNFEIFEDRVGNGNGREVFVKGSRSSGVNETKEEERRRERLIGSRTIQRPATQQFPDRLPASNNAPPIESISNSPKISLIPTKINTTTATANPTRQSPSAVSPNRQNRHLHPAHPTPEIVPPYYQPPANSQMRSDSFARDRSFNLTHLPRFTHQSIHGVISLHPPTHANLRLHGSKYEYMIPVHGNPITVINHGFGTESMYELADLPWKHLDAYRYVRRFVEAAKKRTTIAFCAVDGGTGRLWADGRAVVDLRRGVQVEIKPGRGEATVRHRDEKAETLKLDPTTLLPLIYPPPRDELTWAVCELEKAARVYRWLQDHPDPQLLVKNDEFDDNNDDQADDKDTWCLTPDSKFVKGVGWCRVLSEGRYCMKYLDGVRLEIYPSGEVAWIEEDTHAGSVDDSNRNDCGRWEKAKKKVVKSDLNDPIVRKRVCKFAKAGL
jgi:hypothetical protein